MNTCTYQQNSGQYTPSGAYSYFYKELDLKNKQIAELKARINNLLDSKQNLQEQIENLKAKNYSLSSNCEQETQMSTIQLQKRENELINHINNLQRENSMLKMQLNKKEGAETNFQNTIAYKLAQAQKEVDNLSVMNTYKDNILSKMEEFYNKLNNIAGTKFNYTLDYCNDDLNIYSKRMKEIEDKVIHQLQFEDFHSNTQYFNNNQNPQEENKTTTQNITTVNNISNSKTNKSMGFRTFKPKTPSTQFRPEECIVNTRSCNCAYNHRKSPLPKKSVPRGTVENIETSLTRTPPRDEDYISPSSEKMDYLRTINENEGKSRRNYNFYP